MELAVQLLRQIDAPYLTPPERLRLRCKLARELEEAGNYEAAREALGELWRGVGVCPDLEGLDEASAAQLLLRVGALSGWIGSARQVAGAQEAAKDLISRSLGLCEALRDEVGAAAAQIELGWCYWREGAFDEARVTLGEAAQRLGDADDELKAYALLRLAAVERSAARLNSALSILTRIAPLVETCDNHALKGKFHNTLAHTLEALGVAEDRQDYTDRALIESAAASFHFEQAGHTPHTARVENNLGFLLLRAGRYADAHQHLDRARSLFVSLRDASSVAQVDETRARTLLAQGRNSDAERVARGAVSTLKKGGEQALLAEAMTTYATALARLGRAAQAEAMFEEAVGIAELAGDTGGAGRALLTLIEELCASLSEQRLRATYQRADALLSSTQHGETLARLRACATRVIGTGAMPAASAQTTQTFLHAAEQTAELLHYAQRVALTGRPVLITGETGAGKEVLARLVHQWSGRGGRFIAINCAALSDSLLETQLFGHRRGSFTDAIQDHAGTVLEATGGTLFLDEVGELSAANQSKLLRLIESGEVCAVGSAVAERVDVRIVAATNHELYEDVEAGRFRTDLYYRLETFQINIPPLRERPEDILPLATHFIEQAGRQYGKRLTFTPDCLEALKLLQLRGNARELRSLIERTYMTARDGAVITGQAVRTLALRQTQKAGLAEPWAGCSLDEEVRLYEGQLIRQALEAAEGRVTTAARLLGMTHQALSFILKGRQKELLSARRPAQQRRRSALRQVK